MTDCAAFYSVALPFIIAGSVASVGNLVLQYIDIIYRPSLKDKNE